VLVCRAEAAGQTAVALLQKNAIRSQRARRAGLHILPRQHRTKLHSTNSIERLTKEVKRRADVVRIFPYEASIMRLIGAVLFEQNDEWQTSSRYMMVEAFAQIDKESRMIMPSGHQGNYTSLTDVTRRSRSFDPFGHATLKFGPWSTPGSVGQAYTDGRCGLRLVGRAGTDCEVVNSPIRTLRTFKSRGAARRRTGLARSPATSVQWRDVYQLSQRSWDRDDPIALTDLEGRKSATKFKRI
jgi:hypothetical protein